MNQHPKHLSFLDRFLFLGIFPALLPGVTIDYPDPEAQDIAFARIIKPE